VGRVWDCILCTCVSEEGGDGEGESSETPSLLSNTLRYVSFAKLGHVFQFGLRAGTRGRGGTLLQGKSIRGGTPPTGNKYIWTADKDFFL
jgi:hypothetical protein